MKVVVALLIFASLTMSACETSSPSNEGGTLSAQEVAMKLPFSKFIISSADEVSFWNLEALRRSKIKIPQFFVSGRGASEYHADSPESGMPWSILPPELVKSLASVRYKVAGTEFVDEREYKIVELTQEGIELAKATLDTEGADKKSLAGVDYRVRELTYFIFRENQAIVFKGPQIAAEQLISWLATRIERGPAEIPTLSRHAAALKMSCAYRLTLGDETVLSALNVTDSAFVAHRIFEMSTGSRAAPIVDEWTRFIALQKSADSEYREMFSAATIETGEKSVIVRHPLPTELMLREEGYSLRELSMLWPLVGARRE
ncbi:MAG: hypothetical protein NUW37_14765 [Planctomycetes bacterium]|nr:hypothetical protein [Planctomycetota bacterium]